MPPRLIPCPLSSKPSSTLTSLSSFLLPFLHQQARPASILSSLSDTKGAYNKRIRRGRGPSSGKGKTSGRGHKGQKQHGKVPAGFTGGQTKDEVVRGKHGFKNMYEENTPPSPPPQTQLLPNANHTANPKSLLALDTPKRCPPSTWTESKTGSTKSASTRSNPSRSKN